MKILIMHHIEPMWKAHFRYHPDEYLERIAQHIEDVGYDQVILTTLEGTGGYTDYQHLWNVEHEWTYGWEDHEENPEWYADSGIDPEDIIRALGHEFTYLYPWIKALAGHDVTLIGGSDSACLEDLCNALHHLEIPYKKEYDLVY